PLLRVHAGRLPGRDTEEFGIEEVGVLHEAAVAGAHLAHRVGVGIVEGVDVPTLGRHFGDRVSPQAEGLPERLRVFAAGDTATQTDDGERLAAGALAG